MEITSKWIKNYQFKVDNGRNQSIIMDVPPQYGGKDTAPTALEYAIMALATCLGTTYKMIADKMHLDIQSLEVKANADKTDEDKTVTSIYLSLNVASNEQIEKLEKCLMIAEENCPVDLIFHQTQIPMKVTLEKQ